MHNHTHRHVSLIQATSYTTKVILSAILPALIVAACGQPDTLGINAATPISELSRTEVDTVKSDPPNPTAVAQPSIDTYLAAADQEVISTYHAQLQRTDLSQEDRVRLAQQAASFENQVQARKGISPDYLLGEKEQIDDFLRNVANGKYDTQTQQQLGGKLAIIERNARDRALALQQPQNPKIHQSPIPLPPQPTVALPRGIITDFSAPFSSASMQIANAWQDEVNGNIVRVYSGAYAGAEDQGVVVVATYHGNDESYDPWYPTPTKAGVVKIVRVQDLRLTLQAQNGTTFMFDLPSRIFVASDGTLIAPAPPPTLK